MVEKMALIVFCKFMEHNPGTAVDDIVKLTAEYSVSENGWVDAGELQSMVSRIRT
ncbi:hypothetical protein L9F63_010946, partial [Diploptera punctata]